MHKKRCNWAEHSELEARYHDEEWGVPSVDDRYLFEMITLEGAQAGLSWNTVLQKRANYKRLFANFDPQKVAKFKTAKIEKLLTNSGIIRNRLKIESTVSNAQVFLLIQKEHGSFADFLWNFVNQQPIQNRWKSMSEVPTETPLAKELSRSLKKLGFRFVGPTICYAFMQAVGMVNDHLIDCYRYKELRLAE